MMIKCCGQARKASAFYLAPKEGEILRIMKLLLACPNCYHYVLELGIVDGKGKLRWSRYTNSKALKKYDQLECDILCPVNSFKELPRGKFYLTYNEYGKKKKCYSNLSTLRLGRGIDNFERCI